MGELPELSSAGHGVYFLNPVTNSPGPLSVSIEQQSLYRFMDYIYVPGNMEDLDRMQIHCVNALRRKVMRLTQISDMNRSVKSAIANSLPAASDSRIVEWGCGFQSLLSYLKFSPGLFVGVDVDPDVIHHQTVVEGIKCFAPEDVLGGIEEHSVHIIPAVFVFHFRITPTQIDIMKNLLSPDGVIVANIYRRSEPSRTLLLKEFSRGGIDIIRIKTDREHHEFWVGARTVGDKLLASQIIASLSSKANTPLGHTDRRPCLEYS